MGKGGPRPCGFTCPCGVYNQIRLKGFEPLTFGSVDRRSIQLSYRRKKLLKILKRPLKRVPKKTEERGFEPLVPLGTTVFKTATISHSVTPPNFIVRRKYAYMYIYIRCILISVSPIIVKCVSGGNYCEKNGDIYRRFCSN